MKLTRLFYRLKKISFANNCDMYSELQGDCLNAIGKHFHPECFTCSYCNKLFGNSPFFLEDGHAYCETDWNELFTTKCFACGFPVEAGDRWVEALSHNYHSSCFNCTVSIAYHIQLPDQRSNCKLWITFGCHVTDV